MCGFGWFVHWGDDYHGAALVADYWGWYAVDIFAIDVCGLGDKGAAAIAALSVALLEAEELDFGLKKVDKVDHFGGVEAVDERGVYKMIDRMDIDNESES